MSGLRMSIAQSALRAINVMQDSVKALIMRCPLSGHLDKRNHYSAYLSVEELGIAEIDTTEDFELPLGMLKVNIFIDKDILHQLFSFHIIPSLPTYKMTTLQNLLLRKYPSRMYLMMCTYMIIRVAFSVSRGKLRKYYVLIFREIWYENCMYK